MANGTIAGAGNAGNPFLIEDADDLNAIRNIVKQYPNNAYYYKLVNDIDLNTEPYNQEKGWEPIPSFAGVFDGNGHVISNLYINDPELDNAGLFSIVNIVAFSTSINDLGIINVNINAKSNIGAFAGKTVSMSAPTSYTYTCPNLFTRCYVNGIIAGESNIGSFIGVSEKLYSTGIYNCHSSANLKISKNNCGGFFGVFFNPISDNSHLNSINNSYFNGTIECSNLITSKPIVGQDNEYTVYNDVYYDTETLSNITKTNDGIIGLSSEQLTNKNAFSCNFKYQYMSSQNPVWRFIPEYAPKLYFENKSYFFIYFDSNYHVYNKDTDSWVTVDKKSDDGTISDLSSGMDTTIVNNIPYSKIHELTSHNDVAMYCYIKDEKHGDKNVRYIDTIQHKQRNGLVLDIDKYTPEKTNEEENEVLTSIINTKPSHSFNIGYCYETEKSADNILNNDEIEIYSSSEKEKTVDEKNIKATMLIDKVTNNFTADRPYIGDINNNWNLEVLSTDMVDRRTFSLDYIYETEKEVSSIQGKDTFAEYSFASKEDRESIDDITASYSVNNSVQFPKKLADITVNSGNYTKYMLTVDNGSNWLTYDPVNKEWVDSKLVNIYTSGVSKDDINNPEIWKSFPSSWSSKLKIAIGIHSESTTDEFAVRGYDIKFKDNLAPIISNDIVTIHDNHISFSGHVEDKENDAIEYRIVTKESGNEEWKQLTPVTNNGWVKQNSEFDFNHEYQLNTFKSGNNTIKIIVKDSREQVTEKEYEFVIDSGNPNIRLLKYNDFSLTAVLEQTAGRKVKTRIFINDKQIAPLRGYSEWKTTPYTLNFTWNSDVVSVGMPNTIRIEVIDDLSSVTYQSFIIEGAYKNLLFRDRNNVYYSTDKGEILEQLDLGKIIGGEIADHYEVFLENRTGMDLENVTVFIDPAQMDEHIKIQVSETGANNDFVSADSFTYSGIMKHNDTKVFYVRAEADNLIKAVQDKVYNIYAKGDPVLD